jgi:hypothetical protein
LAGRKLAAKVLEPDFMKRKIEKKINRKSLRDWIPVRAFWHAEQSFVEWCLLGEKRFTEPFFDDSISKLFHDPFYLLFRPQTPIEVLGEFSEVSEGLQPTGFIYHLSRCGSTLISQMLASSPQNIVISESSPVDFVVRKTKAVPEAQRIKWIRWLFNALGQKRNSRERHFFIKFDSWNALDIELVRRAYPDVPWIFLYRNPVEIIVSHLDQRGTQTIPGVIPEILPELKLPDSAKIPPVEYCARVLGEICRSALESIGQSKGFAVNYRELPDAVWTKILPFFNAPAAEKDIKRMLKAARFSAKNPNQNFSADTEKKKKTASREVLEAAAKFVDPFYQELEIIRKNQNSISTSPDETPISASITNF